MCSLGGKNALTKKRLKLMPMLIECQLGNFVFSGTQVTPI